MAQVCRFPLNVAEFGVDGGAEASHRGREVHVGVDQRRNAQSVVAYGLVEYLVVLAEVSAAEHTFDIGRFRRRTQRVDRGDETVGIREIFVIEVKDHVAAF